MSRAERHIGGYATAEIATDDEVKRRCTCCGVFKNLHSQYGKNGTVDGVQQYRLECKTCYNIKRKENTSKSKKVHSDFLGSQRRRSDYNINFTHQDWKAAVIYFGGTCAYCGMTPRKGERLTKDHLHPVKDGGETTAANTVPACRSCNCSKGDKDVKTWYMAQKFFSQLNLNKIFQWRTMMQLAGEVENKQVEEE